MYIKERKYYLIHILLSLIVASFFIYTYLVEKNFIFIVFSIIGLTNTYKYYLKYKNFDTLEDKDKTIL